MRLRLTSGLPVLENWSENACQADRNALYRALFAVADGSAFLIYDVFSDAGRAQRFVFQVKQDLMVMVGLDREESFGILDISTGEEEEGTPRWPT
jgi:hypothetical protein